jgi:hypothetical protein
MATVITRTDTVIIHIATTGLTTAITLVRHTIGTTATAIIATIGTIIITTVAKLTYNDVNLRAGSERIRASFLS